jgi:uncharacterized membrane protein YkoI
MNMKLQWKRLLASMLALAMAFSTLLVMPVSAAAPQKKGIKYEGYGKVELEFRSNVQWKNAKVTVKDSTGKAYSVKILNKDNDEIEFKILQFKQGQKYTCTVSGVRQGRSGSYGKVSGSVTIPTTKVSESKAVSIALNDAVKKYKIKKADAKGIDLDISRYRGKKVFEIEFRAKKNGRMYEFEYKVDPTTGKILKREIDD